MDDNGDKRLSKEEMKYGLRDYGIDLKVRFREGTKLVLEVESAADAGEGSGKRRTVELTAQNADDQFVVDRGLVFEPV